MSTGWKYKTLALVFGLLFCVYLMIPTLMGLKEKKADLQKAGLPAPWYYSLLMDKELNLGLDLRGGMYMELEVGVNEALWHQIDTLAGDIRRAILQEQEELTGTSITQILGNRLRVEIKPEQQGLFKKELVSRFGNDIFTLESGRHELFYKPVGDANAARKRAYEVLGQIPGFEGNIDVTHNGQFLAISFADDAVKTKAQNLLNQGENAAFFTDQTGSMYDVLYLTASEVYINYLNKNIIEQAANSARNRIDRFGVAEASVSKQSSDRLVVELPGVKDPDRVIDIVKRTGKLEFRMVNDTLNQKELQDLVVAKKEELKLAKLYDKESSDKLNAALKAELPPDTEIVFETIRDPDSKKIVSVRPFLLDKKAEVTGDMLENASVQSQKNLPYVSMSFNKIGTKAFGDLTSANVGKNLAIVLDGVVNSAPVIKSAITGGQAQIELGYGSYSDLQREAQELVLILKEGALPASLKVATKNIIGPSLGRDSIEAGLKSLIVATLIVIAFMLFYYKVGGIVANMALIANVVMLFGFLTLFGASLTLPGIAGIVLTMGMAVDANVIIFERMREEIFLGKKPGLIVESGYKEAMSAILDGNVTTFIAGLVLFEFGTGPIKGFATTLMIGIITTLLSAVVLTRVIYDWMVYALKVEKIRI